MGPDSVVSLILFHLIHHLVGFGVLVNPLLVWLAFDPEAEDALSGLAYQKTLIFLLLWPVLEKRVRFFPVGLRLGSMAAAAFLSLTECGPGFNRLDPPCKLFLHREATSGFARQPNHFV